MVDLIVGRRGIEPKTGLNQFLITALNVFCMNKIDSFSWIHILEVIIGIKPAPGNHNPILRKCVQSRLGSIPWEPSSGSFLLFNYLLILFNVFNWCYHFQYHKSVIFWWTVFISISDNLPFIRKIMDPES